MHCTDATPLLPELLAGELDPETAERLRAHLAECTACAERHSHAREAWLAMESLAQADARDAVPAADLRALVPGAARARARRLAGSLLKAAVLVLAGFGAAHLRPRPAPPDDAAMRGAIEQALLPMFVDLAHWMSEQDERRLVQDQEAARVLSLVQEWRLATSVRDREQIEALLTTRRDLSATRADLDLTREAIVHWISRPTPH